MFKQNENTNLFGKIILLCSTVLFALFACSQNKNLILERPQNIQIIRQPSEQGIKDLGDNWFEVTASTIIENITPEEAKEKAIKNACKKAIEYYSGILVNSRTLKITSESNNKILIDHFSQLVNLTSQAIILEKEILSESITTDGNVLKKIVTLKVKVSEQKMERDPYFNLDAELNKDYFKEGEKLGLSIIPTKDCYLSIFCLYSNETVAMLLPNEYREDNFAKANKAFKFPDEKDVFSLPLGLLPDKNEDSETIIIIATKGEISFPSFKTFSTYNTFESSLKELMYQLSKIPRNEMEEVNLQYYIYK
ncbi:MAG: DUF4384 domain-containing protein [Candidatus Cloacimonetes bacterium]|nr:DUF4384 domain-containing protein [Candidatus Cloacimonadota bacterium]MBL7086056.1 DUF4384 domain-containing protein [Candidatus Cloacimonadota bacterium]